MTQLATSTRNAMLEAIEADTGTSAKLMLYTGTAPGNCALAPTGTKLAEWDMASDWAADAANGSMALANLPLVTTGVASGNAGYYRIYKSDGTTCTVQGPVSIAGGTGELILDQLAVTSGQNVTITGGTFTQGGA